MGTITTFAVKADRLAPPKRLTGNGLAEWLRMVGRLQLAGTDRGVSRYELARHVRRCLEVEQLSADVEANRKLARKLGALTHRLAAADRAVVSAAVQRLDDLWSAQSNRITARRRGLLRFFHAHQLTPASRAGFPSNDSDRRHE